MIDNILTVFNNLRIQDIFDILIIWIMTSVVLIWFKERASRFVFIGIGLLGVIYLTARFFQLYLTTVVLQGFFAILLFVLVVIFQEDLRRFFEQLAMWGRLRQKFFDKQPVHQAAETIAQAVSNLVRKRIGALIVIKGEDPLDRHLNGGALLNGALSQPLLESIFDPHSAGHDGAVVIEGNRVPQFGCHLPLSINAGRFGPLGLRHTAALGLSERCDALCVVVSEERGTISLAKGEHIRELVNAAALRVELESFYAQKAPKRETRPVVHWLRENSREKIIALLLSCILWVAFGYQKESVRRDFTVPVEYLNVSPDWVIEKPKITDVEIMLMGPPQAFQLLNPDSLKVSVDLSQVREGRHEIALSKDMVKKPSSLTVVGINPARLGMTASRLVEASLPVQVVTQGRPPDGQSVQKISVSPPDVTVLILGKLNQNGVRIRTEPIDLGKLTSSKILEVRLILPSHVQFAGGKPPVVTVTIKLTKSNRPDSRPLP
ncbi:MAG: diadenylate cyclase [Syntrophales bacterium]|nr:diadenylate cyclase [Syntrophales bacterium]